MFKEYYLIWSVEQRRITWSNWLFSKHSVIIYSSVKIVHSGHFVNCIKQFTEKDRLKNDSCGPYNIYGVWFFFHLNAPVILHFNCMKSLIDVCRWMEKYGWHHVLPVMTLWEASTHNPVNPINNHKPAESFAAGKLTFFQNVKCAWCPNS